VSVVISANYMMWCGSENDLWGFCFDFLVCGFF